MTESRYDARRAPETQSDDDATLTKNLLKSFVHASVDRRSESAAARARESAPTSAALPITKVTHPRRSGEMRQPQAGPTEVVTIRPVVTPLPPRRPR
jgi:hypothetical protein